MYGIDLTDTMLIDRVELFVVVDFEIKDIDPQLENIETNQTIMYLNRDVQEWLIEHCKYRYKIRGTKIYFVNSEDAILFKTTWV